MKSEKGFFASQIVKYTLKKLFQILNIINMKDKKGI